MANRRTGLPTIVLTAKTLCRLVTKFTPVITLLFPENEALLAALAAANAACAVLVTAAEAEIPSGI